MFFRTMVTTSPGKSLSLADSIFFAIAALLPTAPTLVYLFTVPPFKFWFGQVLTSVLILLSPLLLGLRPKTYLIALSPFSIITPHLCAYALATGYSPSIFALQILREANAEEIQIFLPVILICSGLGLAILIGYWHLACRWKDLTLNVNTHLRWGGLLLLILLLGKDIAANGISSGSHILISRLEKIHPVSPVVLLSRLALEKSIIPKRESVLHRYSVATGKCSSENELCILVIGESARKSSFGLYNKDLRETTPCLNRRDLVVFSNTTSCGTATIQSIPILLTGSFPSNGEILPFSNLGLVEAFRLAGFHTTWFSTQNADGEITSFVTTFSVNAHERRFFNGRIEHSHFRNPEIQNDSVMLEPLNAIIRNTPGRLFVVLHTLGSHIPYPKRYPVEHEKWALTTEAKESMWRWLPPFDASQRSQIERAYLNSIHFTDWFLDQVIKTAAASKRCASVTYISDHGENGPESKILPAAHGSLTDDVIKIPFFLWLSPEYAAQHPAASNALRGNATKKVSAQDLFSTLCGMHGLKTDSADNSRNLATSSYVERERRVLTLDGRVLSVSSALASADN